jgi:hypothetical protein
LDSVTKDLWELSRHALRRETGQIGQLHRPTADKVALVIALLWDPDRSAWGGLGAKVLRGLKDSRGTVDLGGVASGVAALSDDVDMSLQARMPYERLASRMLLLWKPHSNRAALAPCWSPTCRELILRFAKCPG